MTSRELIKQTLKYVNAEEGGKKLYTFKVYDPHEKTNPILIITVGDLFSTAINAIKSGKAGIAGFKNSLRNIKSSLTTLGNTSLNSTISQMESAATAIEVVKVIEDAYRVIRPIVVKAADIGDIIWNVAALTKMAQDIQEYITKIGVSYARKLLQKLWERFLASPVFAIYANDYNYTIDEEGNVLISDEDGSFSVLDFSNEYQELYDKAIEFVDLLLKDDTIIDDAIKVINDYLAGDGEYITKPGLKMPGLVITENINDVYFDRSLNKMLIASDKKIYEIDVTTFKKTVVFETSNNIIIDKIFYEDDTIFFVHRNTETQKLGNTIWKVLTKTTYDKYYLFSYDTEISNIVFTNDKALIIVKDRVYDKDGYIIFQNENDILKAFYNDDLLYYTEDASDTSGINNNIFYCVMNIKSYDEVSETIFISGKHYYKLINEEYVLQVPYEDYTPGVVIEGTYYELNTSGYMTEKVAKISGAQVVNLSFFDNYLYAATVDATGTKYDIKKICSNIGFDIKKFETNNSQTVDGCYVENGHIASGKSIFSYNEDLSTNIITLEANSLPVEINSLTIHEYEDEEYYICTSGYGFLVSKINTFLDENWKLKNLYYDSDYVPEELDTLSGSLWDEGDFYYYSQQRIFKLDSYNTSQLFENIEDLEPFELPDTAREPYLDELWNNTNITMIANGIRYSEYYEAPDGYRILKMKKIEDEGLMVSMCYDSDQSKNGIFWVTNQGLFNCNFLTPNIRVYDFDKLDDKEIWYLVNAEAVYSYYVGDKIRLIEDASSFLSNSKVIISVTHDTNNNPVIFLNDGYLIKSYDSGIHEIKTDINIDKSHKIGTACTPNNVLFFDNDYYYNILKNKISDRDTYQIISKRYSDITNNKLIQSKDSAFIVENNKLGTVPIYQSIKSHDYHCGYFTDTTVHNWAGAAPYYLSSEVLKKKKNKYLKEEYIDLYRQSFKDELDKLLKNAPDAFMDLIRKKLTEYLESLDIEIEGDNKKAIINACIESISDSIAISTGLYITQHFHEKIGDGDIYSTFSEAVAQLCYNDTENDMTKDFYDVFKSLAKSILEEVDTSYHTIDLETWLIAYYQDHKYEWEKSITDLTNINKVSDDIILIPIAAQKDFDTWDNLYHQMFYDNLITAKNKIKNYTPKHADDLISDNDWKFIDEVFNEINYNPDPNDSWQAAIKESVKYYYIPTQGQQYRDIVNASNMDPIQWNELPSSISHNAFETALNMLLDTIKKKINEVITWLVDSGQVKCYSCVTAESIIERMMEENAKVYRSQEAAIYKAIKTYTSWTSLKTNIDTIFTYAKIVKPTKALLSKILSDQSELYAEYVKKIVNKHVIDTDAEVEA